MKRLVIGNDNRSDKSAADFAHRIAELSVLLLFSLLCCVQAVKHKLHTIHHDIIKTLNMIGFDDIQTCWQITNWQVKTSTSSLDSSRSEFQIKSQVMKMCDLRPTRVGPYDSS